MKKFFNILFLVLVIVPFINSQDGIDFWTTTTTTIGRVYHPAKAATSELDPTLPGLITGSIDNVERLAEWVKLRWADGARSDATPVVEDIIADQFHGYQNGVSHIHLADGLEELSATLETSDECRQVLPCRKQRIPRQEVDRLLARLAGNEHRATATYDGPGVRIDPYGMDRGLGTAAGHSYEKERC